MAAVLASIALLTPKAAHAAPPPEAVPAQGPSNTASPPTRPPPMEGDVTLTYRRGAGAAVCPDEAALRERAADAFDFRDPFVPPGKQASGHLRVEIDRVPSGYQGKVLIVDESGAEISTSTEHHADCDALVWLIAHRLALAIVRHPKPPLAPVAAPPPAEDPANQLIRIPVPLAFRVEPCDAECQSERARRAAPQRPPETHPTLTFTAGGFTTAGWTTDIGFGAWVGGALRDGWWSLGVELRGTFPAATLLYTDTISSSAATASFAAVPCAHWSLFSACFPLEVGPYFFLVPTRYNGVLLDLLVSAGPRAAVDIPLAPGLSLKAFADLRIHPYLPVFLVHVVRDGKAGVAQWHTPLASAELGLGLTFAP